jgi:hypothetical protein
MEGYYALAILFNLEIIFLIRGRYIYVGRITDYFACGQIVKKNLARNLRATLVFSLSYFATVLVSHTV